MAEEYIQSLKQQQSPNEFLATQHENIEIINNTLEILRAARLELLTLPFPEEVLPHLEKRIRMAEDMQVKWNLA